MTNALCQTSCMIHGSTLVDPESQFSHDNLKDVWNKSHMSIYRSFWSPLQIDFLATVWMSPSNCDLASSLSHYQSNQSHKDHCVALRKMNGILFDHTFQIHTCLELSFELVWCFLSHSWVDSESQTNHWKIIRFSEMSCPFLCDPPMT